jgi:hypothetical protein
MLAFVPVVLATEPGMPAKERRSKVAPPLFEGSKAEDVRISGKIVISDGSNQRVHAMR